jgi:methyl-accepting chemotaxis protein
MSLVNAKISRKLAIAFALLVLSFVAVGGVVLTSLESLYRTAEANRRVYAETQASTEMLSAMVEQQNSMRGFIAGRQSEFLDKFQAHHAEFTGALARFRALKPSPAQAQRADRIEILANTFYDEAVVAMTMAKSDATVAHARDNVAATARNLTARAVFKQISDDQDARLALSVAAESRAYALAKATIFIGGAAAVAIALFMGWLLTGLIARPVGAMTQVMLRLADGDHAVDIPARERSDEVGEMARAVAVFLGAAIEKKRLEAEAGELRDVGEAARAEAERERETIAREQGEVVAALASGLEHLSDGDLTYRLRADFAPAYRKLRDDFNAAMEQLQQTLSVIVANADGIRNGSNEITRASDDLSHRTATQAASLEETASALDQITATVRHTAEGAQAAHQLVLEAETDARQSHIVVGEAVDAMARINASAREISKIVGIIDEIAFQTNLLALNAGVEAARAGDAGRGFAVVAQEVRALAQRSAEAAKEIKGLINDSSGHVDGGAGLVGNAGEALGRIGERVQAINRLIAEIAASAQEQAGGLAQVNVAVNQMDQVTQQNAAMVEQTTAASHALREDVAELTDLIGRFQVGEVVRGVLGDRRPASPAPARRLAAGGGAADWDTF